MKSTMEGRDEESRQHRVTGHSPTPGAAAGRKGLRPRRVTLFWIRFLDASSLVHEGLGPLFFAQAVVDGSVAISQERLESRAIIVRH